MLSEILKKTVNKVMVFCNVELQTFFRHSGTIISLANRSRESGAIRTLGVWLWVPLLVLLVASAAWAGELIQIAPIGNPNVPLQINAYGGAKHGTTLKVVFGCPPGSTDCTWTFLPNGMIVSDSDPTLAWNAYGGASHGANITLVNNCTPDLNGCTWTVRSDGLIVSNTDPQLAVNAYGGATHLAPLKLVNNCTPQADGCKWVTSRTGGANLGPPRMLYSADTNNVFGVNAYGGAKQGTELQVVKDCPVGNWDCMWQFQSNGMILSASSASLAWNAYGGAKVGTKVTLVVGCPANNSDCQWDLRPDGLIVSRTNPNLAVKAEGGPHHIAPLVLVDDCTPAIAGCKWATVPSSRVNPANALFNQIDSVPNLPPMTLKRPFHIVAIGDSIMWGQGLRDEHKFVNLVVDWLKKDLGKHDIFPQLFAHSGAILYPNVGEQTQDRPGFFGEVPYDYPSIYYQITQLDQTKVPPSDVDLVLVDGCINVVEVGTIIYPFTDKDKLATDTRAACETGMQGILTEIARTFPRAKIIVTGYYPIISSESSITNLLALWTTAGVIPFVAAIANPVTGPILLPIYRGTAAELSDTFYTESSQGLRRAVQKLNDLAPLLGGNRFRYASPKFEPSNSYGADLSWLWLTPHPLSEKDEVFDSRQQECVKAALQVSTFKIYNCPVASLGHPNTSGARAYAIEIRKAIAEFLPEWRAAFGTSPLPDPPYQPKGVRCRSGQRGCGPLEDGKFERCIPEKAHCD